MWQELRRTLIAKGPDPRGRYTRVEVVDGSADGKRVVYPDERTKTLSDRSTDIRNIYFFDTEGGDTRSKG